MTGRSGGQDDERGLTERVVERAGGGRGIGALGGRARAEGLRVDDLAVLAEDFRGQFDAGGSSGLRSRSGAAMRRRHKAPFPVGEWSWRSGQGRKMLPLRLAARTRHRFHGDREKLFSPGILRRLPDPARNKVALFYFPNFVMHAS